MGLKTYFVSHPRQLLLADGLGTVALIELKVSKELG